MKTATFFTVIIAAALIFLNGCASSGNNFREENVAQLNPGATTLDDAVRILGAKPQQTIFLDNGTTAGVWQYVASNGVTFKTSIKQVTIYFDKSGKMTRLGSVTNIPLDDADRKRLQPISASNM